MNVLSALKEVIRFLAQERVSYAVLGGLAVQYWGEARTTADIDIVVMVPLETQEVFIDRVLNSFRPRLPNSRQFAVQNRVILVTSDDGTPIDISLGIPGYEEEVIRRAVVAVYPEVGPVRLVSAEDLIIHKCVASRPRDIEDVERILLRQRLNLDMRYVRERLRQFAQMLEHDPLLVFERTVRTARRVLRPEKRG